MSRARKPGGRIFCHLFRDANQSLSSLLIFESTPSKHFVGEGFRIGERHPTHLGAKLQFAAIHSPGNSATSHPSSWTRQQHPTPGFFYNPITPDAPTTSLELDISVCKNPPLSDGSRQGEMLEQLSLQGHDVLLSGLQ